MSICILRDAFTLATISPYVNGACAIEAARRRRRFYGLDSEVIVCGEMIYSTAFRPAEEFAEPRVFMRSSQPSEHSTLNRAQQGIGR